MRTAPLAFLLAATPGLFLLGCRHVPAPTGAGPGAEPRYLSEPLIRHRFSADPSAHVFDGRIYVYASHDVDAGVPGSNDGDQYAMRDYHVYSMKRVGEPVADHGVALALEDVPWADRQLWAPDAARVGGRTHLFFPAKDREGVFRIGVAVGDSPSGPFRAEPRPLDGAFSIDPAVFRDDDGEHYLYFGGLMGGQLQRWQGGRYDASAQPPPKDAPAAAPRVARLRPDLLALAEPARELRLLDHAGHPLLAGDEARRFFEGAWVHKHEGRYYFSYSTGTTHQIVYATGDSPYGPFTYQGVILKPVKGWTTHHSIVKHRGKWYLFYHDAQLSGQSHLRNVKVTELRHRADGSIETIDPFVSK